MNPITKFQIELILMQTTAFLLGTIWGINLEKRRQANEEKE